MKAEWIGRWKGRTVVCIASGPSLTEEDCETVRLAGHPAIVTNTTFRRAPWADVLFGFDGKWWREYGAEAKQVFQGQLATCSILGKSMGIHSFHQQHWFQPFGNSGTAAISLAIVGGAKRVVLIGYDCQKTGGQTHWHPDHPKTLGNAKSIENWPRQFKRVAAEANTKGVEVLNCSRASALNCFKRAVLADALRLEENQSRCG